MLHERLRTPCEAFPYGHDNCEDCERLAATRAITEIMYATNVLDWVRRMVR